MGLIRVSVAELRQRAEMINEANNSVKAKVADFDSSCQALAAQWEGEARDAFVNAYTQDLEQMNNFISVMDGYYHALMTVADNYEKAEARNTGIANSRTYNGGGWTSIGEVIGSTGLPGSDAIPIHATPSDLTSYIN